ncbi:MAG TPA: hypothetical protein PLQ19_08280 [Aeromicrobium sp.]|nr:hypothetical protein [Aeromicrobium sp.]
MTLILAGTAYAVSMRTATPESTSISLLSAGANSGKDLRLAASVRTATAGTPISLSVTSVTNHPRKVTLQRWDASRRSWRTVGTKTVRKTATFRHAPAVGVNKYRAQAPKLKHRLGGKSHTHKAAVSSVVAVTATATAPTAPTPAPTTSPTTPAEKVELSPAESNLFDAIATVRQSYAPTVHQGDAQSANDCLTTYAREHSAWMADQGAAADPGSDAHKDAGRQLPAKACAGFTVNAVTRAVGAESSATAVIDQTIKAWLSSPYGEPDRLLSVCQTAPSYEFGVAIKDSKSAHWVTVLVASETKSTKTTGVC